MAQIPFGEHMQSANTLIADTASGCCKSSSVNTF